MENWFLVHPEPVRGRQSLTLLKNAKNRINGAFLAADSGSGSGENAKFYRMKKNCIELISISYFMTRWVLVHPEPARGLQSATAPKNAQNGAFAGRWREGERPNFFFGSSASCREYLIGSVFLAFAFCRGYFSLCFPGIFVKDAPLVFGSIFRRSVRKTHGWVARPI